jgi:hypothetical protein
MPDAKPNEPRGLAVVERRSRRRAVTRKRTYLPGLNLIEPVSAGASRVITRHDLLSVTL